MPDMEKVELGIKACWSEYFSHKCFDCPYMPDRNDMKCVERLGADALALLKEQGGIIKALESDLDDCKAVIADRSNVVRCKDCKHRDPEDHKCDCGHDIQWQLPRADDWFCADGERR